MSQNRFSAMNVCGTRYTRSLRLVSSVLNFCSFSNTTHSVKRLTKNDIDSYIRDSLDNFDDVELAPYRINGFVLGTSYQDAHIDFSQYSEDNNGIFVNFNEEKRKSPLFTPNAKFSSIFKKGFRALKDEYVDEGWNPRIKIITDILKYGFIPEKEIHEMCLQKVRYLPNQIREELYITTILTNHLFSRLTSVGGYLRFVANNNTDKSKFEICPCRYCDDEILLGNTGIGSEYLFYGRPDVKLYTLGGDIFNIVYPSDNNGNSHIEEMDGPDISDSDDNNTSQALRCRKNISKFISQVITFSFYQRSLQKRQNKKFTSTLIPTLAVTENHFDIYIYDCENDILLRNYGEPIPLWNEEPSKSMYETLNMSSVLMLWMVLNHMTFTPCLSDEDMNRLSGTCDFLPHISQARKQLIENTVDQKKRFHPIKQDGERELLSV
ncbi:uncharacterized protein LOC127719518 [Mytilus californianus]|uniref:uncharacterized protein LOC127719518 n=1 Tax=Mytilus californianus TaxID=6549 RepID=UPI002247671B|nr:uncharacterized protein LOC127719518 [Mytilus californianus]